eukprot:RCo028010
MSAALHDGDGAARPSSPQPRASFEEVTLTFSLSGPEKPPAVASASARGGGRAAEDPSQGSSTSDGRSASRSASTSFVDSGTIQGLLQQIADIQERIRKLQVRLQPPARWAVPAVPADAPQCPNEAAGVAPPVVETKLRSMCPTCGDLCEEPLVSVHCPHSHSLCAECFGRFLDLVDSGSVAALYCPICPITAQGQASRYTLRYEDYVGCWSQLPEAHQATFAKLLTASVLGNSPNYFLCPGCTMILEIPEPLQPAGAPRGRPVQCPNCQRGFCAHCKQLCHPRCSCAELREHELLWNRWTTQQRPAFRRQLEHRTSSPAAPLDREAAQRLREFERDEAWKERNCRLCPGCHRVVQKIDGCNQVLCGHDYHGGNEQQGCGLVFDWSSARAYARTEAAACLYQTQLTQGPGRWGLHPEPFWCCGGGGAPHHVVGPLFRCLNCEEVFCWQHEAEHGGDHVLQVVEPPPDAPLYPIPGLRRGVSSVLREASDNPRPGSVDHPHLGLEELTRHARAPAAQPAPVQSLVTLWLRQTDLPREQELDPPEPAQTAGPGPARLPAEAQVRAVYLRHVADHPQGCFPARLNVLNPLHWLRVLRQRRQRARGQAARIPESR